MGGPARLRVPDRPVARGSRSVSWSSRRGWPGRAGGRERTVRGHGGALPAQRRRAVVRRRGGVRGDRRPSAGRRQLCGTTWPARGGAYARRQFSWPAVVDRYAALAGRILAAGRRPPARRGATAHHYDRPMRHPSLSRVAARVRRSLGLDDLARRLDAIETRLAGMPSTGIPTDPSTSATTRPWWPPGGGRRCSSTPVTPWSRPGSCSTACGSRTSPTGCKHTLQPGQVFVDVGANIGYFTLLGGMLVGPRGPVSSPSRPTPVWPSCSSATSSSTGSTPTSRRGTGPRGRRRRS